MKLDVRRAESRDTLELVDQIERRQVTIHFPSTVSPVPTDAEQFVYPVDRAVCVVTDALRVTHSDFMAVLDPNGELHRQVGAADVPVEVPAGEYYLDVSSDLKTYLWVDAPESFEIDLVDENGERGLRIDFGTDLMVRVGVRSVHTSPEATITTTRDPRDVMTALSYFGSALRATGPDRSFPSLRGHPPELAIGEELHVPAELRHPDTGITLEVPPTYAYVFPVASLAYYLGAEVVPGEQPRLRTDTGYTYELGGPDGFEPTVERVLKQVFTCDTYVRAAGPLSFELERHDAFVRASGLEPDELYDRSLPQQLEAYLAVTFEAVEPFVPEWGLGAHLATDSESIEFLPYLADDLAVIHEPRVEWSTPLDSALTASPTGAAEAGFVRGDTAVQPNDGLLGVDSPISPSTPAGPHPITGPRPASTDTVGASGVSYHPWPGEPIRMVAPVPLDTQEQLWVADGLPRGLTKPDLGASRRALERDPVEEIEVLVVCNDDRMAAEDDAVRALLGSETPFDVTIRAFRNLPTDQLRTLLERGADVLHYIGHIDDDGFACPDGHLDASTLEAVNVDVCFLNACRSYDQGQALVDAGAIAGVVTLDDVMNRDAVRAGRSMARFLHAGFPLNTALRFAGAEHGLDDQYTILGDGRVQITQAEDYAHLITVSVNGPDDIELETRSFVTPQLPLGSACTTSVRSSDGIELVGDSVRSRVTLDELADSVTAEDVPVLLEGALEWSSELDDRLRAVAAYCGQLEDLGSLVDSPYTPDGGEPVDDGDPPLLAATRELQSYAAELQVTDYRLVFPSAFGTDGLGAD